MTPQNRPAISPRSVGAALFITLLSALANAVFWFFPGDFNQMGSMSIPAQVVFLFLALCGVVLISRLLVRREVLTKAEGVAVLFIGLIAAPLTNAQLWGYLFQVKMELIRGGRYEHFDAATASMLPSGPNLAPQLLTRDSRFVTESRGDVSWEEFDGPRNQRMAGVTLRNSGSGESALLRIRLPYEDANRAALQPRDPHFFSFLWRTRGLSASSEAEMRVLDPAGGALVAEARTTTNRNRPTAMQPGGFSRVGIYNLFLPHHADAVDLEFVLSGPGEVSLALPVLYNVAAIEDFYSARPLLSEAASEGLAAHEKEGMLDAPTATLSWQSLKLALGGIIPMAPWLPVVGMWVSFILLLAMATFASLCLVRRQWLINERYPFPVVRLWQQIIGSPEEAGPPGFGAIHNRIIQLGFLTGILWAGLRAMALFNPAFPDPTIAISVESYVQSPSWSEFWKWSPFYVSFLLLGLAVFLELNILMSLVLGFFLFRLQLWAGEVYGWRQQPGFPNHYEQIFTALLIYGGVVLFFLRRHLYGVFAQAWRGQSSPDDVLSPRAATILLLACLAGSWLWAAWTDLPGMVVFITFVGLLICSWLLAKLRAEAGLFASNIGVLWGLPISTAALLAVFPSIQWMGVDGALFLLLIGVVFLLPIWAALPGAQVDLLEAGRQYSIKSRHLLAILLLGLGLGSIFGPGAYLTFAYTGGVDNLPGTSGMVATRVYTPYNSALLAADGSAEEGSRPFAYNLMAWTGGLTAATAILRQWFAGFWFHPVGIIGGMMPFMAGVWGTFFVAWVLRFAAVKFGGALFVREKFLPFFVGIFLGTLVVQIMRSVLQFSYYQITGDVLLETQTVGVSWLM